ncbi:MAG: MFS transporter [Thermomicrobiales bacterium]
MTRLTTAARVRAYNRLLVGRDFPLLFLGQAVSQLGDWMNRVALLVLAYALTGQGLAVAIATLAQLLPRAFMLPFGGVLADRFPKRRLMIATDLARALLAASLIFVDRADQLWWVYLSTVLLHTLASIFNPARGAILPALVPAELLGPANALNNISMQAAIFFGPALGGLLVAQFGVDAVFLINGGTFIISALLIALMRAREPELRERAFGSIPQDLREGWAVVRSNRTLRTFFAAIFISAVVAIGLNVLLVSLLANPLGQPTSRLGLLLTCVGLGMIAGAAPALWLFKRYAAPLLALGVTAGVILTMFAIGLTTSLLVVAVALFINGLLTAISDVVILTTVQRSAPPDRLGRVMGLLFWVNALGQIVGAAAGGLIPRLTDPATSTLLVAAIAALLLVPLLPTAIVQWRESRNPSTA